MNVDTSVKDSKPLRGLARKVEGYLSLSNFCYFE